MLVFLILFFTPQLKAEPDTISANALSFLQAPPESVHYEYNENPSLFLTQSFAIGNNVWTNELYTIDPNDLTLTSVNTGTTAVSSSGDFAPGDVGHMWIIDMDDGHLKRLDVNTGLTDQSIFVDLPMPNGMWTVLTINKITGEFFGVATNGTYSEIHIIDPVSGDLTPFMNLEIPAVVSGTFDGGNLLYLFDIMQDEMWVVDVQTLSIAMLGTVGFDGNYAQGMGFDPSTGEIYLAAYNNTDGAELRMLDQTTGATTLLGPLPGETTGFGFSGLEQQDLFLQAGLDHYTIPFGALTFGEDLPPIPDGFFGPGSEPFVGRVNLKGTNSNGGQQAQKDATVSRLQELATPEPFPVTGTVPIEMVELNLQSVQPIIIQTGTGQSQWNVEMHLMDGNPSPGVASITREDINGGNFNLETFLFPVFVFTNIDNPDDVLVFNPLEFGFEGLPLIQADPFTWMAPPIPNEFDPFGEEGMRLLTPSGNEFLLIPMLIREDFMFVSMNENGQPEEWNGTGFNNSEWYYYPFTDWWNVWFYDHPLDITRHKLVSGNLEIMPRDPSLPSYVEIIINWSTPVWPTWNGFPEIPLPPLPDLMTDPDFENQVIERSEPIFTWEETITEPIPLPIPSEYLNNLTGLFNFNPEWISIDIRGFNFIVTGELIHICFKPWSACEVVCPEDMEVCATDEPFALSGATPAGGIYSGNGVSADGTFDPGSASWGNNTITYTYVCPDGTLVSCSFNIYVIPPPEMVCPPDIMVCYGDVVTLSGGIPGGGTYSGSGVTGNTFSSITSGIGSHQIAYSVTNPCPGECSFTITVNPNPEIICPEDFTMCENDNPIDLMTLVSPQGGTFTGGNIFNPSTSVGGPWQIKYTYTDPDTGCTSSCVFYITVYAAPEVICPDDMVMCESDDPVDLASLGASPAGGTFRDALGNVVTAFDPTGAGPASYVFTYCYTDPQTGCEGCCEFAITVYPNPDIECPDDFTMCEDDAPIDMMTLVSPQGGSFGGGQIYDPSTAPHGVPIQIKYTYIDPVTGCKSSCVFYITVYPSPDVECPEDMVACEDDFPIALTASPAGGTFSGTGISGNFFKPGDAGVGTHTIEYCYTDPQTGCEGCCEFTITVYPLPVVNCPPDMEVCVDDPAFLLTGATPAGGQYSDFAGNPMNIFNPANAGVGLFIIYYDYTDPQTGCSNYCYFTITVHPLPNVSCPPNMTVCLNDPAFALGGAVPAGGDYSDAFGVPVVNFNPAVWGVGVHTIYYDYTDPNTGCSNSCSFTITVLPLPNVTCPQDMVMCIDDGIIALAGGMPAGGTYAGPGVAGGNFNPVAAGTGVHNITYTYTDPITGCSNSCTFKITVNPLPVVTCPANISVCIDTPAFPLAGATPAGGVYSDIFGIPVVNFNPAAWGVGLHMIFYDYTDPVTGCSNWCSFTINVNPLPVVTCPANMSVCIDTPAFPLAGATPAGGFYSDIFGIPVVNFNPAARGVGLHLIFYDYTDPVTGCSNWCSFTINVNPLPVVTCPANMSFCIDAGIQVLAGANPVGGTFAGPGVAGGTFDPATAGAGVHNITYTYTDPVTNCSNSCNFTITVFQLPQVNCPANLSVFIYDQPFPLAGATPVGGVYTDAAGGVLVLFDPSVAGLGNHKITYTYTDNNGCTASCEFWINVFTHLDYGDAPDGPYPTLLASNGARHLTSGPLRLGSMEDGEADGFPTIGADGDDLDLLDDEDGVTFTSALVQGQVATVDVIAATGCKLNAWIDFNQINGWADTGEHVFSDVSLAPGVNTLSFVIPSGASIGDTYARFRVNSNGGLSYDGYGYEGEVEDYRIEITQSDNLDFGDAPDNGGTFNYHTLIANNGARHKIDPDVFLGDLIDAEADGQPTINALGDDNNNLDDEDGVRMRRFMAVGDSAKVRVKASVAGFLNAWIDFNRDGNWSGPGEQIFTDQPLLPGWNTLKFLVPTFAEQGRTYARFRFNTTGGLTFEGPAEDGEVEDYQLAIFPEGWGFEITDLSHLIVVPVNLNQVLKNSDSYVLMPDDALGLYFDDSTRKGAGGLILSGDETQVMFAYGDDPTTPIKEGFAEGETMHFRVWSHASGEEFDVQVGFDPDQPNSDGKFHNNGLSALTGIELLTSIQTLNLAEGWSGISTYLNPTDANIENMFSSVSDEMVVMYKLDGSMYWPGQNLNTIGQWDTYDGHVIKMSQDATLEVSGDEIDNKSVFLESGLNLIPVLSSDPANVELLFSTIPQLVLVKEVAGIGVYLPQWGINTLGSVLPGSAYFAYTNQSGSISYSGNELKGTHESASIKLNTINTPWNLVKQVPGSHVVVFNVNDNMIQPGDVIGGFTGTELCAGIVQVDENDESFALILNADDPFDDEVNGFQSHEEFNFRLYRASTNETFDLEVKYSADFDQGSFVPNGMSEVLSLKTSISGTFDDLATEMTVYPNPSSGMFNLSDTENVKYIEVSDAYGKLIFKAEPGFDKRIDLSNYPTGIYFLKAVKHDGSESIHKLIVQ